MPDTTLLQPVLFGDVDGDGQVSTMDVSLTAAHTGPVTETSFRSDVNLSGRVTSADINLIRSLPSGSAPCP